MERMPSIFNDVLSPVTPGPSSSNTCGPYRIARLARALLGEPPRRITVRMARRGGYYDTFYSMHSHEAILAALLGQELLRCDLSTMCRQADEAGLCYDFQFVDDLPVRPSELAEMELSGDRRTIRLTGVSLGGGEIEITRLNGSDILLRGKRRETVCLGPEGARVVSEDAAAGPGQWLARLEPLFPFPQQEGAVPFRTAQEMFAYARDTGRPLWRVAFDYESALTGATEAELRAYARQVLDICRHARQQGVRPDNHFLGITDARAAQLCELLRVRRSRVVLRPGALFKKALEERAAPQRVAGNGDRQQQNCRRQHRPAQVPHRRFDLHFLLRLHLLCRAAAPLIAPWVRQHPPHPAALPQGGVSGVLLLCRGLPAILLQRLLQGGAEHGVKQLLVHPDTPPFSVCQ